MDSHRFDEIARSLATSTSRRRVLKGLGGGLVGALAASLTARRAAADHKADHCAKEGQQAHPHKPCCPPLVESDDDGRCEAAPPRVIGLCQEDPDDPTACSCMILGGTGFCTPVSPCGGGPFGGACIPGLCICA